MFAEMFHQTSAACCGVQGQRCVCVFFGLFFLYEVSPTNPAHCLSIHRGDYRRIVPAVTDLCQIYLVNAHSRPTPPLVSFISTFKITLLSSSSPKSEMPLVRERWRVSESEVSRSNMSSSNTQRVKRAPGHDC